MKEQNEIDLIELYQNLLVFIFKKKWIIFSFILIGIALGSLYYIKKSKEIKTNFLAESKDISKELVYSITDKIAFEIETQKLDILSSNLRLDNDLLEEVHELSVDTSGSIFKISIISSTEEALVPFTEALVHYINNQPFILNSHQQKKEKVEHLVQKIKEEIDQIDLLQKKLIEGDANGQVTINQINGVHSEKIKLYKMLQEQEDILKDKHAVKIINKGDNKVRKSNSFALTILASVFLSLLAALFFFFIQFSIKLKNKA